MKVAERIFSRDQWLNLLNDFSDLVADKKYTKINYDDWRILSKPVSTNVVLELSSGLIGIPIIFIQSGAHTLISVEANDGSLGDFLFENVFNKEEQAISMNNSSIDTQSSSITYENIVLTQGNNYYSNSTTTVGDITGVRVSDKTQELEDKINQCPTFNNVNKMIDDKMKEKENVNMKGFNFDFGPCGNTVRLSMYGMAIQNISGEWVSYNPDSHEIINVDVFSMADGGKYIYKMPVAIADVKIGDIVIHSRVPMFVTAVNENGTFDVIDVRAGETKTVIPTRSPFGFNFMTKIVSLFSGLTTPDKNNPFGNMWMFAMLSDDKSFDVKDMMMISMMTGKNNLIGDMNPMMMMLMMSDNSEKNDWLMPLMLMNSSLMNQPYTCQCTKSADEVKQI